MSEDKKPPRRARKPIKPMYRRLMVVCDNCGLLVGWCESPPDRFYCIPCFDLVPTEGDNA